MSAGIAGSQSGYAGLLQIHRLRIDRSQRCVVFRWMVGQLAKTATHPANGDQLLYVSVDELHD